MKESDWNKLADEYTQRDFPGKDWIYGYRPVLDLLGEIKGKKILDYGCGSGKFSRILAGREAEVIGVDPTRRMIELAQAQESKDIEYRLIQDNNIGFAGSVDVAVMTFVFCTRWRDEEVKQILNRIYSSLNIGGQFVMLDPHPNTRPNNTPEKPNPVYLERMTKPVFDFYRSVEEYEALISGAGYKISNILETKDQDKKLQYLVVEGRK